MATEFKLTESEETDLEKFLEECINTKKWRKDKKRRKKGKPEKHEWLESFTFSYTGIGIAVYVNFGPYKKNITDYGSW